MTTLPARLDNGLTRISRCLVHWDARDAVLATIQGHAATLTRAATGTATDANGTSYTAAQHAPRWEARDIGSGGRDALGLRLAADDLTWAVAPAPRAMTLYVAFVEAGTRTGGDGLVYLGNDGQTGARLILDSSGSNYRVTYHDGSTSRTATLATGTPATDAFAELRAELRADGSVRLGLSVNGGAETVTAASSTLALASAWGSGAVLRANRVGSGGAQGSTWLRSLKLAAGVRTMAAMRALF